MITYLSGHLSLPASAFQPHDIVFETDYISTPDGHGKHVSKRYEILSGGKSVKTRWGMNRVFTVRDLDTGETLEKPFGTLVNWAVERA